MRRVLSIDGGGIRGLIPALVLESLEQAAQTQSAKLFDLLSGTSTGGIIACGLAVGAPAAELVNLYEERGPAIFTRRLLRYFGISGPKYSPRGLRSAVAAVMREARLGDNGMPELIVPAFRLDPIGPYYFRSWKARGRAIEPGATPAMFDYSLVDVCMATSAAPDYFPPALVENRTGVGYYMADGGVHANNPVLAAVLSAKQLWADEPIEVLSVGTGSSSEAIDGRKAQGWGWPQWAEHALPMFMDGMSQNADVWTAAIPDVSVTRIQIDLPNGGSDMDDASKTNLNRLHALGAAIAARRADDIRRFASRPAKAKGRK